MEFLTIQGSASAVAEAQASGFARAVARVSVDCLLGAPLPGCAAVHALTAVYAGKADHSPIYAHAAARTRSQQPG